MVEINSSGNVLRSNKLRLNNSIYSNPVDVVYDNGNYYLVGAESYTHVGEGFFLTKYNTQSNSASVKYFSGNMRYTRIEKYNSKLLLTGFTTINNKNYQYYNLMDTQNFDICEGANITANFIPIQLQENNHSYSLESNLLQSDEIFEPIQSSCLYTNVTLCKTENNKSYYKVEYKTSYNIDTTIHICKNSTIAFNGKIYGSTGIFYDTISHQYDCDTIFKIEINARSSDSTNLQYSICQGDTIIIHGKAIHQEGEYSINLVNASGCDSILLIVIHLTNLIKINKNYSICHGDSIKINGIYYKNSISFQDTIYGLNQCDSIIHINIVQAEESNSFIELNICDHDSILIDQKYYSSEGIHTLNYTNQSGCDSIVKVQIHKLSISTNVIDTFVCNEEFIKIGDVIILQPGYYFIDLKNYLNCDSLIEARVNSKDCYQIYIPNAFSPNQDMVNDEFKIYHNGVSNLDIEIYDRWGGLVFNLKFNIIHLGWKIQRR
ncbi:MAG: gliding motility-associated C-terminal domain-containing protein [Saprospiraceae bacterium]|nr:gliding motility-associated C-terminal domain-containing protein [Saprospiraceae bacterium]